MANEEKYDRFTLEDLLADESFIDWIKNPAKENHYWEEWQINHPEKITIIQQAKTFIENIDFKGEFPSDSHIHAHLNQTLSNYKTEEKNDINYWSIFRNIAAILIVVFLISVYFFSNKKSVTTSNNVIAAKYGEIKNIALADSSIVVLNAHSSIQYYNINNKSEQRYVRLSGEAYFNIKHLNIDTNNITQHEKFTVYTNDIAIHVLGTSFNVKESDTSTQIILEKGCIQIEFQHSDLKDTLLFPGDIFIYKKKNNTVEIKKGNMSSLLSWRKKEIFLNNSSLLSVSDRIKSFYGCNIIWKDSTLQSRKMEGVLKMENISDLIFIISTTMNIKIYQENNDLIFDKL